jgi:hypothetical protein
VNVVQIARPSLLDVPAMLRKCADDMERGDYGEVSNALLIIDSATAIHTEQWGELMTCFGAIGLLEAAKLLTLNEQIGD